MSTRADRVAERIKEDVSEIIRRDVDDARIGFVSLTDVKISPDLKNARVFVSILGNDQQKADSMQGLNSATRFIRGKLGHRLELREVPSLSFALDDSLEKGSRVLGVMSGLAACRPAGKKKNERGSKRSQKGRQKR